MKENLPTIDDSLSFDIKRFLQISGLKLNHVYNLINSGQLRAKKLGKRTIILKSDAILFLESLPDYQQPEIWMGRKRHQ